MENDQAIIDSFFTYADADGLSLNHLASLFDVSSTTVYLWKREGRISRHGRAKVMDIMAKSQEEIHAFLQDVKKQSKECSCNTVPRPRDPMTVAMMNVWKTLSDIEKARVFLDAVECRDASLLR